MTPEQFAYWLQGFAELDDGMPNQAQWALIRAHLDTVFNKVTPKLGELKITKDTGHIDWSKVTASPAFPLGGLQQWGNDVKITC
jgi:hypothetical protein